MGHIVSLSAPLVSLKGSQREATSILTQGELDTLGYARHYKLLKELEIKYPDKKEQQRIVTILDQAFDGIATAKANAEKNLKNAREIFESHLNAVFTQRGEGWVEKRLDQVTSIINGVAFKSENFSPAGEAKCIKITNFGVREFVCVPDGGLPLEFESKYSTVAVPSGSIVIALTRTIISSGLKVAIVPTEYHNALLNQRVAAILPIRDGISIAFLFAYLSTRDVFNYVSERVNTLMQLNLSINELRAMPIPIPSTQQQEMLTEQLSSIVRDPTFRIHLSAKAHSS